MQMLDCYVSIRYDTNVICNYSARTNSCGESHIYKDVVSSWETMITGLD